MFLFKSAACCSEIKSSIVELDYKGKDYFMPLPETIKKIISRPRFAIRNEANTIDRIVFPILMDLGWDIHHKLRAQPEVEREYLIGKKQEGGSSKKADIVLLSNEKGIACLIEAKSTTEKLDAHTQQLIELSAYDDVKISVLTNGWDWEIYLPHEEGSLRRVATIDLSSNRKDNMRKFEKFIARDALLNGSAERYASHRPHDKIITKAETITQKDLPTAKARKPSESTKTTKVDPLSFTFLGKQYRAKSKVQVPLELLSLVYQEQPTEFYKLDNDLVSIGLFISSIKMEFNKPEQIADSNYYFEKDADTFNLLQGVDIMLYDFGYTWDDLLFHYKPGQIGASTLFDPKYVDYERDESVKGKMILTSSIDDDQLIITLPYPRPTEITILGEKKQVRTHVAITRTVYAKLLETNPEYFSEFEYQEDNRARFVSANPEGFNKPKKIPKTDFYFHSGILHLARNPDRLDSIFEKMMSVFGYTNDDYSVNLRYGIKK